MTSNMRPILTLGRNESGDPIIPRKLLDMAVERQKEEAAREARALTRAEAARYRAELRESRRQAIEQREANRKEGEDRRYAKAIEKLHRQWEAKVAERERKAEYQRMLHAAEIRRRQHIMTQSLRNIEVHHHVDPEDFVSNELTPVHSEYGDGTSRDWWPYSGQHRREAALIMSEHLGQWRNKRKGSIGRGPRPPHKQRHGWRAHVSRAWSRREYVESKWDSCLEY